MKIYPLKKVKLPNNEEIAYRESGQGETLVLVHGNMSSSVHFLTLMSALENYYHVIALDLRGFGESSYHQNVDSLNDFVQDVIALVDYLSIDTFNILGWSTGGGIVLEVAAALKERVKKVFLLSSVGLQGYRMYKKGADFQPILTEELLTKEEIAEDPVQVAPVLVALANNNRDFMKAVWTMSIYKDKVPSDDEYELYLDDIMKQRNLVDVDYSLVHFNITDENNGSGRINDITAEVIIIHGKLDGVVDYNDALKTHEVIKNSQLFVLDHCGHSIPTDDLETLVSVIRENM